MAFSKRILDSFHNLLCRKAMVGLQQGFKLGYIFFFRQNIMVKKFVYHIYYSRNLKPMPFCYHSKVTVASQEFIITN